MSELIRKSWDSGFFGFEVGSLSLDKKIPSDELNDLLIKAKKRFRLLYLIAKNKEDIQLNIFEKNCTYVDERIIFEKRINGNDNNQDNSTIEYTEVSDGAALYELAFESGTYSRFKMDSGFGEEQFESLYRLMIDNALTKGYADRIFIKKSNKIEGFVTVKQKGDYLNIGLIGVDPEFQGLGVGSSLMKRVENYANEIGANKINVLTQKQNTVARNFYKKQGFHEAIQEYIFHVWF